jgi:plastocyanin
MSEHDEQEAPVVNISSKHPRRLALIVALVVLACLLALILGLRHHAPTPATKPAAAVVTVNITDTGFVPATLLVKSGATVEWHNQTASPQTVGSNPYPSHTSLPGLDGKTVIPPDGSYSYNFSKSGTFGYSNYSQPTMQGIVTVGKQ